MKSHFDVTATCITYFGKVTVSLDREIVSDGCCSNEKEARESAYKVLWQHLHIDALSEGKVKGLRMLTIEELT